MLFVIFLVCFSYCPDIVQNCTMEGNYFFFCLKWTLYYSVDQFQQGVYEKGKGWRAKERLGSGHQQFFFLLFYLTFKDHCIETCWSQSSGCWPLRSLRWLGFFSGCQTAGGTQWLNVFGCHWSTSQSDRWATVGVGFRKSMPLWGNHAARGFMLPLSTVYISLMIWNKLAK